MEAEVVKCNMDADCWRVEAIDFGNEGLCYVACFTGPNAEQRAREYASFKYALTS